MGAGSCPRSVHRLRNDGDRRRETRTELARGRAQPGVCATCGEADTGRAARRLLGREAGGVSARSGLLWSRRLDGRTVRASQVLVARAHREAIPLSQGGAMTKAQEVYERVEAL